MLSVEREDYSSCTETRCDRTYGTYTLFFPITYGRRRTVAACTETSTPRARVGQLSPYTAVAQFPETRFQSEQPNSKYVQFCQRRINFLNHLCTLHAVDSTASVVSYTKHRMHTARVSSPITTAGTAGHAMVLIYYIACSHEQRNTDF